MFNDEEFLMFALRTNHLDKYLDAVPFRYLNDKTISTIKQVRFKRNPVQIIVRMDFPTGTYDFNVLIREDAKV